MAREQPPTTRTTPDLATEDQTNPTENLLSVTEVGQNDEHNETNRALVLSEVNRLTNSIVFHEAGHSKE